MLEGVAVVEADRWGDAMQTWSFPELGGVPLDRCGLGEADESYGVLRFWSVGPLCYYCFPEKVGKALEFMARRARCWRQISTAHHTGASAPRVGIATVMRSSRSRIRKRFKRTEFQS